MRQIIFGVVDLTGIVRATILQEMTLSMHIVKQLNKQKVPTHLAAVERSNKFDPVPLVH
jgi:hypothetical protein